MRLWTYIEKRNLLRNTVATTSTTTPCIDPVKNISHSQSVQLPCLNSYLTAYQSAGVCTESKLTLYLLGTQGPLLREH